MYILNPLPYKYDALEPYIDTHTLGLHHQKHQQKYLNNLNKLLSKNNYQYNYSITDLSKHIMEFNIKDQENIMFNLGGVINHDIYFQSISPNKTPPNTLLQEKINQQFGSLENFKQKLKEKALSLKGSGYTFLVQKNHKLEIINLANQENPYYYNLIPLIGLDMWEHAYYLNYKNEKEQYIDNFLEIMDFQQANKKLI